MSHDFRAVFAALAVMALCACATTNHQNENEAEDMVASAVVPAIQTVANADTAPVNGGGDDEATRENLLYGAMTKYELMSFVEAVSNADLQGALEADGPMTVFAPNSQAFEYARLSDNADLGTILKGHIVPGAMNAAALKAAVVDNGGPVTLMSLAGTELTVYVMDETVKVAGPSGNLATITQADMMQSNGVMHQISSVLAAK